MKKCQIYQQKFMEALYCELESQKLAALNQHLAECESCRAEFEEMKSALGILSRYERTEPEAAYWSQYSQRLEQRMEKRRRRIFAKFDQLMDWLNWLPGWTYQAAGAFAILLLGIYIGYLSFGRIEPSREQLAADVKNDVQLNLTGQEAADYLERSKILLLGIVNLDQTKGESPIDFAYQQKVSRDLLNQTIDLKLKIQGTKYQRLQILIAELEMILLQIANLEKELDSPAIDVISSGVDKQAILLKINLEEMLLDAGENKI